MSVRDIEVVWQRNYYENIIRTVKSYQRIREYIKTNAKN
jgi:REP element-mobilizing transposase RayT